jgi:glycosyltransferase involved in cell wall biosynthesis
MKFAFAKHSVPSIKNIGISVLVCAKNEAVNLKKFIPAILNQDHPKFELILINDGSTDDSLELMNTFMNEHNNLKVVDVEQVEAFWNNKKYALTLGIKSATYNFLLLTDADCRPLSDQWITEMSRHFSKEKTIVIGYGSYKKVKNSLLNLLIRFETVFTAMQYFSYAKIGHPYMAVGRNLAYQKDEFFNARGFMSHMQVRSGDDDLFVNQVATEKNTSLSFEPSSFTESVPKNTFKDWFNQKRRHITTAKYYKSFHKFMLGGFYISQILFWILSIILLIFMFNWEIVLALVILRFVIIFVSYGFSAKKLKEADTILFLPFLELFLILTQLVIFISNLTSKTHHWR